MNYLKISIILTGLILMMMHSIAQDYLVRTNGSKIPVKIIEVEDEFVKYRSYKDKNSPTIVIKKSQLKYVEYENGEFLSFNNIYKNMSDQDTIKEIKQIKTDYDTIFFEGIKMAMENLFRQNKLYINFLDFDDSTIVANKSKLTFSFNDSKNSMKLNFYKHTKEVIYTTFDFNLSSSKKNYKRLKDEPLSGFKVQSGKSIYELSINEEKAKEIMLLFNKYFIE